MTNYNWDESEHPRDDIGRFTFKNGGGVTSKDEKIQEKIRKENAEHTKMQKIADILYPTMKNKNEKQNPNVFHEHLPVKKYLYTKLGGDTNEISKLYASQNQNTYTSNNDYKLEHDTYRDILIDANTYAGKQDVNGYKPCYTYENKDTGFYGRVYVDISNKEIVIAYKGSDTKSIKDWLNNNIPMWAKNKIPEQVKDAEKMYNDIKDKFKNNQNYKIVFTGYSLGGSIAQIMGAKYGNKTVTYNAYGAGDLRGIDVKYTKNIINYSHTNDIVSNFPGSKHIGKTINVKTRNNIKKNNIKENHTLENLGNLRERHISD